MSKGRRKTTLPGINAWLKPWVDCPCGSKEHQEAGHEFSLTGYPDCVVTPHCGHCFYCLRRKAK